jgi:hypothetical protein
VLGRGLRSPVGRGMCLRLSRPVVVMKQEFINGDLEAKSIHSWDGSSIPGHP